MSNMTFRTRRLDDRSLFDLFERAKKAVATALEADGLQGHDVTIETKFIGPDLIGPLSFDDVTPKAGKYTILNAQFLMKTLGQEGRQQAQTQKTFIVRRGDQGELDHFEVPGRGNGAGEATWQTGKARAALLASHEVFTDALVPIESNPDDALGQLTNFAANVDASFRGFTQGVEKTLQTLADQRAEGTAQIEQERERVRIEIEGERKRILDAARADIEALNGAVEEREKALDAREADLEVKSHKDARRKLFNDLQESLVDSTKTPTSSRSVFFTRWAVFLALMVGSLIAANFALNSMTPDALPTDTSAFQVWVVILKPIGLSVLSLGSLAAAVGWLRHFYTRDLRAAEDMQRFGHDMARAAWIMEAFLEMTKEHGIENIPESWLINVSEGLFHGDRRSGHLDEGAQALAALLGLSASAKVGADGFEATLGKKQLRKIAEAANASDG